MNEVKTNVNRIIPYVTQKVQRMVFFLRYKCRNTKVKHGVSKEHIGHVVRMSDSGYKG